MTFSRSRGSKVKVGSDGHENRERDSSWTTKTYTNTSCTQTTKWLALQGHGAKGQGHRNVLRRRHTDRRVAVEYNLVTASWQRIAYRSASLTKGGRPPPPSPSKKTLKGVGRGHSEYLKCSKTVCRPEFRPRPRWESLQRSPRPPRELAAPSPRTPPPLSALWASFPPPARQQILKTPLSLTVEID